jgi:hypothetical protein
MNNEPHQLSLFDLLEASKSDSSKMAVEKLKWSYSKRSKFEQCLRAYYYVYFGALSNQDLHGQHIQFLKALSNRYLRLGSITHLVIKTFFKKAQQGEVWKRDRLINWGLKLLREDRSYSQQHPDGKYIPPGNYPPNLLMEYYYGFEDVEDLYDEAETRLRKVLTNFISSQSFTSFRLHGQQPEALVEKWIELSTLPHIVTGQVDLAYKEDNIVNVIDWKIGKDDSDGEDSLQLAVYALWATDYFRCHPDQIRVYKAFLGSEEVISFTVDQSMLEAAKIRILQDAERMSVMEAYGHQGIASAFTPCYQAGICRNCPFQELCYE